MVRLRAGWDPERVYAYMDERVRALLRSLNTCRAIDCEVERFADHWTTEQLAALEERLAADVVKIRNGRVRRQYRQFFKRRMDELREFD